MKAKSLILFSFLIFFAWAVGAYAQEEGAPAPGPMILTDEQDKYPLGLYLEILEDPGGELTIDDVTSPAIADQFRLSNAEVPNFGFTKSAYWVRLPLRNESEITTRWLLEIVFANMHFVDLYMPLGNGAGFEERQTGAMRPVTTRDIRNPRIILDLQIPDQSEQTIYLRFQSGASMTLDLILWEPLAFVDYMQTEHLRYGIFFGVLLAMLAYNLFLLFSLRERSYLFLTLFIANFMIFEASYLGYLEVYIAPGLYFLKTDYMGLTFALVFVWTILFGDHFLQAKKRLPRIHKANIIVLGVWGILILLIPFANYLFLATVMVPWGLPSLAIVLVAGLVSWREGNRAARFFLFAWLGFLVSMSLIMLVRLGIAPSTGPFENAYLFGIMWMVVSWSIALADRINLMRDESEEASRSVQHSRNRLAQILEGLPLGVVVYGVDARPSYTNRRVQGILGNPRRGINPDISAGRTLGQAMDYYAFKITGTDEAYPLDKMPVFRALQGEADSADDLEADLIDERVPLEVWASPVFDGEGNVESAVVAFQDITKRKQAELALRASEKRFRVIVENVFDGIAFLARDRTILYVSPSYKQLNGLNPEELIGTSGALTIHPDDRVYVAETFQRLLQEPGGRVSEEYRIRHKDGSWVWVETRVMNLLDDAHVQAVVLNSRNVTERKRAEAELAEYREHLEQLVRERTELLHQTNQRLMVAVAKQERLEEFLHKRIQWMGAFSAARQEIKGAADLPSAFEVLCELILHLVDAQMVFILRLDGTEGQHQLVARLDDADTVLDEDSIRPMFQRGSLLRRQIDQGQTIAYADDEVANLPAPLRAYVQGKGNHSLLLAPMIDGTAPSGVLGIVMPEHIQNLIAIQGELIPQMAVDLLGLAQYGSYLDQTRTLIAAEERNRLARDLHDSVTQVLFTASLVAEVLPSTWRRDPERAMQSLEELRRLTRGALAEMRTMLLELRPSAVTKSPLHDLVTQLTEASTSRTQLDYQLFIEKIPPLPPNVHACFYRVAQEALNNVAKHAQAERVTVRLNVAPPRSSYDGEKKIALGLVVEDDGIGFSPQSENMGHLGLGIMRERAADIQADLIIESHIAQGTRVSLDWCGPVGNGS